MPIPPNKYTKLEGKVASVLPSYLSRSDVPQTLVLDWEFSATNKLVHSGLWGYAHLYAQIHERDGSVLQSTTGNGCRDEWMADICDMLPAADNTVHLVGHIIRVPNEDVCSESYAFFNTFIEVVNAYYQTIAHPKWSQDVFFTKAIHKQSSDFKFSLLAVVPSTFSIGAIAAISSFIRNALLVWALATLPKNLKTLKVIGSFTPLIGGVYDVYALLSLITDETFATRLKLPHHAGSLWAHVFTLCDPIKKATRVISPLSLPRERLLHNPTSVAPHELKNIYTPFCGINYGANAYAVYLAMCEAMSTVEDSYPTELHNAFLQAVKQTHSAIKR